MRTVLVAAYGLAAVLACVPGWMSWRRGRESSSHLMLSLILFGLGEWSLAQGLSVVAGSIAMKRLFNCLIYPGVCAVVAGFFVFSLAYSGRSVRMSRRGLLLLCVEPVGVVLAAFTDPWHHAFYHRITVAGVDLLAGSTGPVLVIDPGPLYWVHTVYSYTLIAVAGTFVVRAMPRTLVGHRRLLTYLLIAFLPPLLANALTVGRDIHAQSVDLTPLLFLFPVTVWWRNQWREPRTTLPVAASQVLNALEDAVLVLSPSRRILYANPAARVLLGRRSATAPEAVGTQWEGAVDTPWEEAVGTPWEETVRDELVEVLGDRRQVVVAVSGGTVLDVRTSDIDSTLGLPLGTVVTARDVTEVERLRSELADQAMRDGLTQVHNRRYLQGVLQGASTAPDPGGLAVVMIDIDHFKQVNDRFGHAAGDQVLVAVARYLDDAVRPRDTVARYGGEEFVVLLPGTTAETAHARAEAWRRHWEASTVETVTGRVGITLSLGVAAAEERAWERVDGLLRRADAALYDAKTGGRNRSVVHRGTDPARGGVPGQRSPGPAEAGGPDAPVDAGPAEAGGPDAPVDAGPAHRHPS